MGFPSRQRTDLRRKHSHVTPRRVAALGLAAGLTLVVAACGGDDSGGSDGKVTLTVATWDAAEEASSEAYLELIEKFEKSHPDIEIKQEPIPFTDFEQKLLQQVQAGNAPDVAELAGNYTFTLNATGALVPIDELADEEYLDQIVPEVRDVATVDDELVAAPWALQPVGFWYNKKIMAKAGLDPNAPPATIDELVSQLKTIKQKVPDTIPLGIDSTNRVFGLDVGWPWMKTFGAEPISDGEANADTPEMQSYLEFMRTLSNEKYTEVNQKIGYFRPLAAEGSVAFVWDQPILQAVIEETAGIDSAAFHKEWGVTTLPTGESGEPSSVPQDHQLGIMETSEHKEEAWTFVEWMTRSDEAMEHVVANKGSLPPVAEPSGKAAKLIANSPALKVWSEEIIPTLERPPWGADYGSASSPIMVGVQQMMTSDDSVESVTEEMQSQLSNELG